MTTALAGTTLLFVVALLALLLATAAARIVRAERRLAVLRVPAPASGRRQTGR